MNVIGPKDHRRLRKNLPRHGLELRQIICLASDHPGEVYLKKQSESKLIQDFDND